MNAQRVAVRSIAWLGRSLILLWNINFLCGDEELAKLRHLRVAAHEACQLEGQVGRHRTVMGSSEQACDFRGCKTGSFPPFAPGYPRTTLGPTVRMEDS